MREPITHLGARLRELRTRAGLTGAAAAQRSGLSQPTISRLETRTPVALPDQVEALCTAYGVTEDEQRELVEMARELHDVRMAPGVELERNGWWLDERIARIEQAARRVRAFCPTVVHRLAQTRAYARALLATSTPAGLDRTLDARAARQALPDSPDRRVELLLTEGALRSQVGGPQVMAGQLARLIELSRGLHVEVGVIPWTTPVRAPVAAAFTVYDASAVLVPTETATVLVDGMGDIARYEAYWAALDPSVARGEAARETLRRIAAEYRSLT